MAQNRSLNYGQIFSKIHTDLQLIRKLENLMK